MQVCTLHQHLTTQFFTGRMPFLQPNQQRQLTGGNFCFFCFIMTKLKLQYRFVGYRHSVVESKRSCTQGCRSVLFLVPTELAFPRGRRVHGRRTSMGDCRLNVSRQRSALSAALRSSDAVQPFDVWIVYLASTNSSICERGREADTEEGRQEYR